MRYFELEDDMTGIPRWHLDRVVSTDGSVPSLRAGVKCDLTDLQVAVHHAGPSLQFTMTTFGVPIAVLPLSIAFTSLAQNDVQILPCAVSGDCGYAAINVLRILPCIDDALTVGIKWTADDHRSDLAGQYRRIDKLMVDPSKIPEDAQVFRMKDYQRIIIVSETMKQAMEAAGCHGAVFVPVELS
ncbi:MAG: hypothetical protein IPN01_32610 [Deltaproteobacteria bacterium]|jgi:hypothetical protein|nr:hypothetical protein [Deltaproteobacteria bacterium]MBK9370982.1 hypothetical protein [Deltaproteobacteria bacterium]